MIAFLAGAILAHASHLDAMQRFTFPGLFLLSVYMLFRGVQARSVLVSHSADWFPRYVDHIGFTLIALFEGFIIVGGIDVGAPAWLTAAVAVLGVLAGNRTLHRLQAAGMTRSPARRGSWGSVLAYCVKCFSQPRTCSS